MPAPRLLRLVLALAIPALLLHVPDGGVRASPLEAVVGVTAKIRSDGRTVDTLGRVRSGSGVLIDDGGLVLTIGYLILEADSVEVSTARGRRIPAQAVAYHAESGFGLVRMLVPPDVKPARLGSAVGLEVGASVMVAPSVEAGGPAPAFVVSRHPYAAAWEYLLEEPIFVAPGHPGAQGSALFAEDGSLLGIGYLTMPAAIVADGLVPGNMFVPVDLLTPVLADLLAEGRPSGEHRPWLGVYTGEVRGRLVIERTAKDGPADTAGIRAGDILLKIGDRPVEDLETFYEHLWATARPGDEVTLTVLQDADVKEVRIRSGDRYDWFKLTGRSF